MFTGIVAGVCSVIDIDDSNPTLELRVSLGSLCDDLVNGSSVSVNGVCLTVTECTTSEAEFHIVPATAHLTNLSSCKPGSGVNIERSLKFGSEIGGHVLSGHICDTVAVSETPDTSEGSAIVFEVPNDWRRFLFPKGFIALNGVSLTLAEFDRDTGIGRVNLIPETLKRTNLGKARAGTVLNLEVDSQTQSIVETTESFLRENSSWVRSIVENQTTLA